MSEQETSLEKNAQLDFEQAKNLANFEYAKRIKEKSPKFNIVGDRQIENREISDFYSNSSINEKIEKRKDNNQNPVILFTDIDNTFYHKDLSYEATILEKTLEKNDWGLVFVTGRDFHGVINQKDLPRADIIIGAVGTEIFSKQKNGEYQIDDNYQNILRKDWKRESVYDALKKIVRANSESLSFQPRDVPSAYESSQTKELPQEFKISLHFRGNSEESNKIALKIKSAIPNAQVVLSQDIRDFSLYNIDLLPKSGGKQGAIKYLTEKLGVVGYTAGDSGNDLDMLLEGGHPSIIVGNARQELQAAVLNFRNEASFSGQNIKKMPNGEKIFIGNNNIDQASKGIINSLKLGDFNPEDAKWFIKSLYDLSRKDKK